MHYKQLIQKKENFTGNIRILFTNEEKYIAAIINLLKTTHAHIYIYDIEDASELIRSYDLDIQLLRRIHFKLNDNLRDLFYSCSQDLEKDSTSILVKGNISTTRFKKFLTQAFGNASQSFNHIACFDLPQYYKTLVLSDVVYQRFPEYKTKINTIFNLKRFAQSMEYDHFNIGILSSVNQPFVKISSSIDAAKLKEHFAKMNERFITVDGPITLDNAIDKNIAIQKNEMSEVAGEVDALLVPDIDVGNAIYKSFTLIGHAQVASILLGAAIPISYTSRSDQLQTIIDSIHLAISLS